MVTIARGRGCTVREDRVKSTLGFHLVDIAKHRTVHFPFGLAVLRVSQCSGLSLASVSLYFGHSLFVDAIYVSTL